MLKNIQPSHTHSEKCTEGCTADVSIPKKTVSNDTIVSYVKDKNACQHNVIALLNNKKNDEGELKTFFDGFDPPPPPCDSETRSNQFKLEDNFLTEIADAKTLSDLAKVIVAAEIDCQAELFMINDKEHNKLNLWSNIKNRATKISQPMIIPTVETQALRDLNVLSRQTSLEALQTKLNNGKIKHSDIKNILTTDMLPTTDTIGKINLTEGLPETEKKELEKKITEYKNNTESEKDTGFFMAILEWFKNMINKLLGRVGILEEEMKKQEKNTNDNKTELEKQQKKLTDLETKIKTIPAGPKGENGQDGAQGEKGKDATNLCISQYELDKKYVTKEDFKNHTTQYQKDQDAIKIQLNELADAKKQLTILKTYFSDSSNIKEIFNNDNFKTIFIQSITDNDLIKGLQTRLTSLENKKHNIQTESYSSTTTISQSSAEPYIKNESEFITALIKVLNKDINQDDGKGGEIAKALKKIFITQKDFEARQATHNEKIAQLETVYNTNVEQLNTQYTQLKTSIDAIDTKLKDLATSTEFNDDKIIALEKEIKTITTKLKTKDATNDNAIAELNDRIKIIEEQLTKERAQLVTNTKLYKKISSFEAEREELITEIKTITTQYNEITKSFDMSKYVLNEAFEKDQARQDEQIKSMLEKLNKKNVSTSIPVEYEEKISSIPERKETISLKSPVNGEITSSFTLTTTGNPPLKTRDGHTYLTYRDSSESGNRIGAKFMLNKATLGKIEEARGKIDLQKNNMISGCKM